MAVQELEAARTDLGSQATGVRNAVTSGTNTDPYNSTLGGEKSVLFPHIREILQFRIIYLTACALEFPTWTPSSHLKLEEQIQYFSLHSISVPSIPAGTWKAL